MRDLGLMRQRQCSWLQLALRSDKKNVGVMNHLSFALQDLYREFDGIIANYITEPDASLITLSAEVLRDFYTKAPVGLKKKLDARRSEHELDECPYCGNPIEPSTLDHFLPKEDWPEYAILSNNLVPQCRQCMPIKGRRYYSDDHGQALFIHPMYSAALASVLFRIDVVLANGKLQFDLTFSILNNVSGVDERRIKLHLSSLHVPERIAAYCEKRRRHWIRQAQLNGADIEAAFKTRVGEKDLGDYGSNWKIAFYKGMLRNPQAVAHLQGFASHGPPAPAPAVRSITL